MCRRSYTSCPSVFGGRGGSNCIPPRPQWDPIRGLEGCFKGLVCHELYNPGPHWPEYFRKWIFPADIQDWIRDYLHAKHLFCHWIILTGIKHSASYECALISKWNSKIIYRMREGSSEGALPHRLLFIFQRQSQNFKWSLRKKACSHFRWQKKPWSGILSARPHSFLAPTEAKFWTN